MNWSFRWLIASKTLLLVVFVSSYLIMTLVLTTKFWNHSAFPLACSPFPATPRSTKRNASSVTTRRLQGSLVTSISFDGLNETRVSLISMDSIGWERSLYFENDSLNLKQVRTGMQFLAFQPRMSVEEREILLYIFKKFVQACVQYNVTFFLYGGSLLGSLRHHDIIPWDDDIDVLIPATQRFRLRSAITTTTSPSPSQEGFNLYDPPGGVWKFYWTRPRTLLHKPFRWPYVDIFFYLENQTHIFDEQIRFRSLYSYKKSDVFPLTTRPFAGAHLPVPCHTRTVVERTYSPSLCSSPHFSHKFESATSSAFLRTTVPCKHLHALYPFVHRQQPQLQSAGEDGRSIVKEELRLGEHVIRSTELPDDPCHV